MSIINHKLSVECSAPSNIALIKYMGKVDGAGNKPTNSSLSYTLNHLRSFVKITLMNEAANDEWQALIKNQNSENLYSIQLNEVGKHKFLNHFNYLKNQWGIKNNFLIESANNFPSDCGLASSASSFAALTMAAAEIFQKIKPQSPSFYDVRQLSRWSRLGSGSSCRSFFSPWALWAGEGAEKIELPFQNLLHMVVIVEDSIKKVSSSDAHKKVLSSEMFKGRVERAQSRIQNLIHLLRSQKWNESYQIIWDEFWDMHLLFHTSRPAFFYITGGSLEVLSLCQEFWETNKNGPLITMDAGANIHLLFKSEDLEIMKNLFQLIKTKNFKILSQVEL